MDQTAEQTTKIKAISPLAIICLIIAIVAFLIGIIVPPTIRKTGNAHINADCKTASEILKAVNTAVSDQNISDQITAAGSTSVVWISSNDAGSISCANIPDLQTAVTNSVGNVSRLSKTLGTWTITVYPDTANGGFSVNGTWSGCADGNDNKYTVKSGGTVAQ